MSKAQYDLNTQTDYLSRKMFLDPAGPVTIQRFEEVKYNKISKFEENLRWILGEENRRKWDRFQPESVIKNILGE